MKNYIILIICLWVGVSTLDAQRIVFFVHGFGANNSAWTPAERALNQGTTSFPARFVETKLQSYTDVGGIAINTLNDAGFALKTGFRDFYAARGGMNGARAQNAIAIAHSQGGLVTRWATDISRISNIAPANAVCYGGLVTFGTSHGGAQISQSRNDGTLDVFLNAGCNDLGGGVIDEAVARLPYNSFLHLFGIQPTNIASTIKNTICNTLFSKDFVGTPRTQEFLSQKLLGTLLSQGSQRSVIDDPLLNEYRPTAPALAQLNTTPLVPNIKRIAFFGAEINEHSFLRTIHYMIKPSQTLPVFTATDEEEEKTVTKFNNMHTELENAAVTFDNTAFLVECNLGDYLFYSLLTPIYTAFVCSSKASRSRELRSAATACRKATAWMDNSNDQWLSLIGAKVPRVLQTTQCMCDIGVSSYNVERPCTAREIRRGCEQETKITLLPGVIEDNDGIVIRSSALAMPGKINIDDDIDAKMPGSQHMQMRNDPNTRDKLNNLFYGRYDSFFITQ
jgi:hypothetical protein